MPVATKQELIDIWDEFLLKMKSLKSDTSYEKFIESEIFKDFTSMIIPADVVKETIYVYCSYNNAHNYLYSGKYKNFPTVFKGLKNKGINIENVKIVYSDPSTDKSSYHSIKNVKTMIEELKKLFIQRVASEKYNNYPTSIGLDNIVTIQKRTKRNNRSKIIKQSNKLNTAGYNLTITQKKALTYCINEFQNLKNQNKNFLESRSFQVSLKNFKNVGIGNNVVQIKKNLLPILGTNVQLQQNNSFTIFNIFERFRYDEIDKTYTICFTPSFIAFINQTAIHQEYTKINSEVILACNSYYSTRMYELCAQYRNSKNLVLIIDDEKLRFILNCQNKYTQTSDLQKRVLDIAQKELDLMFKNGQSDISFTIKGVEKSRSEKSGRKIISKWLINIKSRILFDDNVNSISDKEKEEICDITVNAIYNKLNLSSDIEANIAYNNYCKFDFQSKIKVTRELQFRLNEIIENKWIFADIINEI